MKRLQFALLALFPMFWCGAASCQTGNKVNLATQTKGLLPWTSISGAPVFLSNPMTSPGDFLVGGTAGTPVRLGTPGNGTFCLNWSSGTVTFVSCPSGGGGSSFSAGGRGRGRGVGFGDFSSQATAATGRQAFVSPSSSPATLSSVYAKNTTTDELFLTAN